MYKYRSIFIFLLLLIGILLVFNKMYYVQAQVTSQTQSVKSVSSFIAGQGSVHSTQEAILHFQTGGKLIYLPFKEGDKVYQGQTIAQLDNYILTRQLSAAINNYQISRNVFDQTQENAQNNLLQGNQKFILETTNRTGISGDLENNVINNIAKRILNENQANLNNAVINVEIANYAASLSSLVSPFDGIIMHEDVTVSNQNITSSTSFGIADPNHTVFRANILPSDIDFVSLNASASVQLAGSENPILGSVTKIYPQKITLSDGDRVYQVDITSIDPSGFGTLDQSGAVSIKSVISSNKVVLIPSWSVLNSSKVWVVRNDKKMLIDIKVGKTHNDNIEIINGLEKNDKVITNPEEVAKENYLIL